MPVYCGDMRSHNVRATTTKKGSARKAHSRSRCRKVSKEAASGDCMWSSRSKRCSTRRAAAKRFNPFKYGSQRGGASECAKKPQAECVDPCKWRSGPKRSFCTAVGVRGPNKPIPAVAPAYERGVCAGLKEEVCSMDPNCNWTAAYQRKDGKAVAGRCSARKGVRKGVPREGPMGPMLGGRRSRQQQRQQRLQYW